MSATGIPVSPHIVPPWFLSSRPLANSCACFVFATGGGREEQLDWNEADVPIGTYRVKLYVDVDNEPIIDRTFGFDRVAVESFYNSVCLGEVYMEKGMYMRVAGDDLWDSGWDLAVEDDVNDDTTTDKMCLYV